MWEGNIYNKHKITNKLDTAIKTTMLSHVNTDNKVPNLNLKVKFINILKEQYRTDKSSLSK